MPLNNKPNQTRSQGHFWVFWPISAMLWSGWSQFFFEFPIPPITFQSLWRPFHVFPQQLVLLLTLCCTVFFSALWKDPRIFFIFSLSSIFTLSFAGTAQSFSGQIPFFLLINTKSDLLAGMGWSICISKSQRFIIIINNNFDKFFLSLNLSYFSWSQLILVDNFMTEKNSAVIIKKLYMWFCNTNGSSSWVGKAASMDNQASMKHKYTWVWVALRAYPLLLSLICAFPH